MPTYEYRCKDCGHEFEIQQAFTDDPLTACPTCSGALKKKFDSVGISFKGSGFYKNDSRGSSSSASTGATATPPTASTESSSDSATKAAAPATPAPGTPPAAASPAKTAPSTTST